MGPSDRNLRANLCAAIEVKHVLVIHTDASVGNLLANQLRRVRSMNSIHRFTEVKCAHTEGIPWIAACDVSRKPWIFAAHISRWRPGWVFPLLAHIADARPFGFSLWDRNRVAGGGIFRFNVIETPVTKADNDLARGVAAPNSHMLAACMTHRAKEVTKKTIQKSRVCIRRGNR